MNMIPPYSYPPRRWEAIGPLRGLVCLSILTGHLYFGTLHPQLSDLVGPELDAAFQWRPGFQCMFLLAGFFLAYSLRQSENHYLSVRRFALRRVLRLAVPYWAALALILLDIWLPNVLMGRQNEVPSFWAVLSQALFVQDLLGFPTMNVIMWSMAALLQYSIVLVFTFWAIRSFALSRWPERYQEVAESTVRWLTVAAYFLSLAWAIQLETPSPWHLSHTGFYLGLGSAVYWTSCGKMNRWVMGAMLAPMFALGVGLELPRLIIGGLTAVLLLLLATQTLVLPRTGWGLGCLAWVGERSYSLYLTHGVIGHRVLNFSNHFSGVGEVAAVGFLLTSILASLAFGALFYETIERPLLERSRTLLYRH